MSLLEIINPSFSCTTKVLLSQFLSKGVHDLSNIIFPFLLTELLVVITTGSLQILSFGIFSQCSLQPPDIGINAQFHHRIIYIVIISHCLKYIKGLIDSLEFTTLQKEENDKKIFDDSLY